MNHVATSFLLSAPGRRPGGAPSLLSWLLRREDRVHLHALSDHTLRDMGFRRDQIEDVLRGAMRRM